jgi:hypothetical protein
MQVVVLAGQVGVVGEVHRVHLERRVAVHELVELLRAEAKVASILPGMVVLLAVGDRAGLDQRQDAVADHFGVDAEVALVGQLHHHRVGNAAVADLQRGAVVDHVGDVLADGLLHRADLRQADFENRARRSPPARSPARCARGSRRWRRARSG